MRSGSPDFAAALSFWLPGLGQLYAQCWWRGVAVLAASAQLWGLAWERLSPGSLWACRWPEYPAQATALWVLSIALWLWNVRDARRAVCSPSRGDR